MSTPPDNASIPLCIPEIAGAEWTYIKECLDTGWVSSVGSYVTAFEEAMAERGGVPHGVATVNGTAALHTSLIALGVERDEEVITSDMTFVAPANAIRYVGAWPVLVDADASTWQMDVGKVEQFLSRDCERRKDGAFNLHTGRRVAAILPVHILGNSVDMTALLPLAAAYELPVLADATEALGAVHAERPIGALGDLACFSFNGNKMITTGGGGMITTANPHHAALAKHLTTQAKCSASEYDHDRIGYNYRLTNIQAAMGCAQLEQLDGFLAKKRQIAERYIKAFEAHPGITLAQTTPATEDAHWLFTVCVKSGSRGLIEKLKEDGIQTRPLWKPMHQLRYMHEAYPVSLDVTPELFRDGISLPCSASLNEVQQTYVIDRIEHHLGPR